MVHLSGALKENSAITRLILYGNHITGRGTDLLSDALKTGKNRSLQWVDIGWTLPDAANAVLDRNRGIQAVNKLLMSKQGTPLDLSEQRLGFEGLSYFVREGLAPAIRSQKKAKIVLPEFREQEKAALVALINPIVLPPLLDHHFPDVISRIIATYDDSYRRLLYLLCCSSLSCSGCHTSAVPSKSSLSSTTKTRKTQDQLAEHGSNKLVELNEPDDR
mmetsp:Transcript_20770/g.29267  ORF Transcript_20770/g.29267 Transcript_20770/m.29267 type:complete len:218 (-) Transcript_20770:150-803(-)